MGEEVEGLRGVGVGARVGLGEGEDEDDEEYCCGWVQVVGWAS